MVEQQAHRHVRAPRSRPVERTAFALGGVLVLAALVSLVWGAASDRDASGDTGSAVFVLGLAVGGFGVVLRLRDDRSIWKLRPGPLERRIVLVVLFGLVSALAVVAVARIVGAR